MPDSPIRGDGYTVKQLLTMHQFRLDPYQREYSWEQKNVRVLVEDLAGRFLAEWSPLDERRDIPGYAPYFLGPFVYYADGDGTALVDGQQRVTTLHLLLIHLRRLLLESDRPEYRRDVAALDPLIADNSYGDRVYTINSPERTPILDAIYDDLPYQLPDNPSPSVETLYQRSRELNNQIPDEVRDHALPLFVHWLLNRVCLVGINAIDRKHGWEIFETMNDRGAQLGPADLLKSFLLRKANNGNNLPRLGDSWRAMLSSLPALDPQTSTRFLQALLIGRYADDMSDVADIEVSFHGWVQDHAEHRMALVHKQDYAQFVEQTLGKLASRYRTLIAACEEPKPDLESVFYNANNELDQMPFLLAALDPNDTDTQFREKSGLVAAYLDLLYIRLTINNKISRPKQLYNEAFSLIAGLRKHGDIDGLRHFLGEQASMLEYDFTGIRRYGLRPDNTGQVRYLLARLTAFVERETGRPDEIGRYLNRKTPFEIEHIWANKFERYQSQVKTEAEFRHQRNRLGALLLLPKSDNASYQAIPYEDKIEYYRAQNRLAASLHHRSHERNPNFTRRLVKRYSLEKLFRPFDAFDIKAIDVRQQLDERLCDIVWDPQRLGFILPKHPVPRDREVAQAIAKRTRAHYGGITIARLVAISALNVNDQLMLTYKGTNHNARIDEDGRIEVESGEKFDTPSPAGQLVTGRQALAGWNHWKVFRNGTITSLFDIRAHALTSGLLDEEIDQQRLV
jgi:hypothetical protein